jgi:SWI/SNF-related matrix-associated actin-dependent regulator 1 of chromatin subfamily A
MLEEQAAAYKQAVNEYRALAETARAARASKKSLINLVDALPRRQVTNIFTQLRKVGEVVLTIANLMSGTCRT